MDQNKNSKDDLVTLRNYTLGVVGFATAVSAILIQALHFRTEPTIICVAAFAVLMLLIVFLIGRAESREQKMLEEHITESDAKVSGFDNRLDSIDGALLEIQRSTLRTEMNNEIYRNPQNHDTILKMANRYFCELKSNWVETEIILTWKENEEKAGRKVHFPEELLKTVLDAQLLEGRS